MVDENDLPHVNASWINNIADEGDKDEAIYWLQNTWNARCAYKELAERAVKLLDDWLEVIKDPNMTIEKIREAAKENGKVL